jgi:hypothetical protein
LPNVEARFVLEHSAHACLLEKDVSLIDFISPDRSPARKDKIRAAVIQYAALQSKRRSNEHLPVRPAGCVESKSRGVLSEFDVPLSKYVENDIASKFGATLVEHEIDEADAMLSDAVSSTPLQTTTEPVTASHVKAWTLDYSQSGDHSHQNESDMSFEEAFNLGQRILAPWRTLVKPVFSGRQYVADAMKDHFESNRPVLFVGNHG